MTTFNIVDIKNISRQNNGRVTLEFNRRDGSVGEIQTFVTKQIKAMFFAKREGRVLNVTVEDFVLKSVKVGGKVTVVKDTAEEMAIQAMAVEAAF